MSALAVLASALFGLATALLYGLALYYAGRLITGRITDEGVVGALVSISTGASAFSLIFSVLALVGLTPRWLVIALPATVLAYGLRRFGLRRLPWPRPKVRDWLSRLSSWQIAIYAVLVLYVGYATTFTLTPYVGADLAIYHLVIPREVLRDGGFVHNPFFHNAGTPLGWHMLGLPAYAIAGPPGYLALSLGAFVLALVLVFGVARQHLPELPEFAPLSALIFAYIYVGMSQASIGNNDIAVVFLELLALTVAAHLPSRPGLAVPLGLIGGLALSAKPTCLGAIALIFLIYLWRLDSDRWRSMILLAAVCLPLALFWPLVALWHTGSPFPQFMNGPRLWGSVLPPYAETAEATQRHFGIWYRDNFYRFFSEGMTGYSVLLALFPAGLVFCCGPARRLSLFLLLVALPPFLGPALLARPGFLFHDRYNLFSYILIGLAAGYAAWSAAMRWVVVPRLGGVVGGWLMVGIAAVGLLSSGTLKNTIPDGNTLISRTPSLLQQMLTQLSAARKGSEPDHGRVIGYVRNELPWDAIVATTSMTPYTLDRRFLQVLPVSQNVIDLRGSPIEISEALRTHGACYLHVPFASGFNPWANPVLEPWADRLRNICQLPEAQILATDEVAPGLKSVLCRLPGC